MPMPTNMIRHVDIVVKKEVIELMARLLEYLDIHHTIGEEFMKDEFISPNTGKKI